MIRSSTLPLQVAALTARVNEARMDRYKLINAFIIMMFNYFIFGGFIKKKEKKKISLSTNFPVCFDLKFCFGHFFSQIVNKKANITLSKY